MSFTSISRDNRRARALLAYAFAAFAFVAIAIARATTADASPCPRSIYFASTNGHYYVAVFSAPMVMKASLEITVYSKTNEYGASLTQLSIEKPWKLSDTQSGFRSYTTVLANPGTEPLLAAAIRPYGLSDSTLCQPEERLIPSIADVKSPPHPPTQAVTALEQEFASEAGDGSNALPMTQIPLPPNSACATPFAPAKLLSTVPLDPALASHTGSAPPAIDVSLTETGAVSNAVVKTTSGDAAVDRAALAAARASTYAAAVFHCVAEAGHYLFVPGTVPSTPSPTNAPSTPPTPKPTPKR